MPTAVLVFDFDPLLRLGDGTVRWETVAIAAAIFAGIVVAGVAARSAGLRLDDLLFVILGIVPGAVVGGRIGYVLLRPAFFVASPGRIIDPGFGSLELTLGVVGGAITGALVALLLDGRPGPWLRVGAVPTLVVLAIGKLGAVLGGTGQGLPTTGEPAIAYLGPGPWGSLGPAIPSIPSQVLEALATALLVVVILVGSSLAPLRRHVRRCVPCGTDLPCRSPSGRACRRGAGSRVRRPRRGTVVAALREWWARLLRRG
ncbi:MAG: hypothetical protein NVS9B8_07680 [Candidatus Limnocylindrales bacterium]